MTNVLFIVNVQLLHPLSPSPSPVLSRPMARGYFKL